LARYLALLVEVFLSMYYAKNRETYRVHRAKERDERSGHMKMGIIRPDLKESAADALAFLKTRPHHLKC
jgi:hypothetical protein